MSDPRNVAHDKKVKHEKEHHHPDSHTGGEPKREADEDRVVEAASIPADVAKKTQELEKTVAVLSKLKEMEFHSRANIETLAELMLTIEDELKQKEFAESIEAVYSTQDNFHTKIAVLIEGYEAKCESLKPSL